MRKLYLIGAAIVFLMILIISFAQVGATCTWYLINSTTPAFLVLLQVAGLGAVLGGLLILLWKMPKEGADEMDEDDLDDSGDVE
jgi:hypothetical protein